MKTARCRTAASSSAAGLTGITEGPDGNLWFAEFAASRVARITPAGAVTEFTLPAGRGPTNITTGPDGNLWFTLNTGDRIGRLNPSAGNDAAIQASITEFAVPGAGSNPNGIVSGPDGALWFTQTGSDEIGRITTAGAVTEFAVPGAGSAPSGIAVGGDGRLWFTQAGSGQIGAITTGGTVTEFTIPVVANGVSNPEGITAGPGGALFFADFGRDQIGRITTSGQITQFNLPVGRGPHQIVADDRGDLYFTMPASGRIGRLPAASLVPGKPTSGSPPFEEFDFIPRDDVPLGITLDSTGDIWFTQNEGNGIGFFEAHLNQITVVATGPVLQFFDRDLNQIRQIDAPFAGFAGSTRVAVNDMNFNGVPDAVVVGGPGGGTHVKVFEGSTGEEIASFFAFDPRFQGETSIAAEDVNGDGRADIIVSAGTHVKVIDGLRFSRIDPNGTVLRFSDVGASGVVLDSVVLSSFFAFPFGSVPSVTLAALDINGDTRLDIVVGAGPGAGPHVKVIDAAKLNQVQADGQIADSALLGSFFAFAPGFRGGVSVAAGINDVQRKIIIGAGPGAGPQVVVVDGTKLNQVQSTGQIAPPALLASFFAFDPAFTGGVRVSSDDINSDAQSELILSAGPGAGPNVIVIDGARTGQVQANGQIAASALIQSFLTSNPSFTGGVFIASDADHRDGPIFGPPGVTLSAGRRDINDAFIFQSPTNPDNTVLALTVSPFSTAATLNTFAVDTLFDFRIANRDLVNTTDDLTLRVTFKNPDANGVQDVTVRALPAALFPGSAGVVVKGLTRQNETARLGGTGTLFRADEFDDPFLFDAAGFNRFLNTNGLSGGTTADSTAPLATRQYPSGTSNNGLGDSDGDGLGFDSDETDYDYNAPNFFANANTLAVVLELPSATLAGLPVGSTLTPEADAIGMWARVEANGVQVDRMGRPAINTAVIPPVPRGPSVTMPAPDRRNAFNAGHPRDDRAVFGSDVTGVLAAVYPIGGNGQAATVATLLLPDILVYDPTSAAGFFGDTVGTLGQPDFFLAGGRKLSDDVVSIEVSVLTDPDTPFDLDGAPDLGPLVGTQNVADDNGLRLRDGSIVGPGGPEAGMTRTAVFPYFGERNPNPGGVPGGNPPP